MPYIRFERDQDKNKINVRKHKISFEEAKTVFSDPSARILADPDHSATEDRFIMLGMSLGLRLLVVCHCYRESDEVIRIISARKATMSESIYYGGKQ